MIIIVSKYLIPKGYAALTFFPFVILREKHMENNTILINHEKIHLRQQAELLILPFYVWYISEFIIRFIKHRNFQKAYKNISFEKEAYSNDSNPNYLITRKIWDFIKFI